MTFQNLMKSDASKNVSKTLSKKLYTLKTEFSNLQLFFIRKVNFVWPLHSLEKVLQNSYLKSHQFTKINSTRINSCKNNFSNGKRYLILKILTLSQYSEPKLRIQNAFLQSTYLTRFNSVLQLYRNQFMDLKCNTIGWILYNCNTGMK